MFQVVYVVPAEETSKSLIKHVLISSDGGVPHYSPPRGRCLSARQGWGSPQVAHPLRALLEPRGGGEGPLVNPHTHSYTVSHSTSHTRNPGPFFLL